MASGVQAAVGSMIVQHDELSPGLLRTPIGEPQCEVLFELFSGNAGAIQLGRMLKGNDVGRLVALRRLAHKPSAELASAMDLARSIAHPRLAKVLGAVRDGDAWYVASEYISGVTLFELGQMVTNRRVPLDTAVAVRIILDALKAADEARRLLADTANLHGVRCMYPESIWVAEFGEIFVSELMIAPLLGATSDNSGIPAAVADVRAALVALVWLLRGPTSGDAGATNEPELPRELNEILRAGAGYGGAEGYGTLAQLIEALAGLGEGLVATEQQVSLELQRVMGLVLERRRQKLGMLERASEQSIQDDDATRCFRVAVKGEQHDTARPPAAPSEEAERAAEATSNLGSPRSAQFDTNPPRTDATPVPVLEPAASTPELEVSANPISVVWRQAQQRLDSSARRAAKGALPAPHVPRQSPGQEPAQPTSQGDASAAAREVIGARIATIWTVILILGIALAVTAAIHWLWASNVGPALTSPALHEEMVTR